MQIKYYVWLFMVSVFCSCSDSNSEIIPPQNKPDEEPKDTTYLKKAEITFNKVFDLYWYDNMKIMYNQYPNLKGTNFNTNGYPYDLGYTFVWGYGSVLSAYNTISQKTTSVINDFTRKYNDKVMNGLEIYYNTSKKPSAYACFPNDWDDRYYDDNVWVGIDLVELYDKTKETKYLEKAKIVWTFIMSGRDDVLGDGIYWKEGNKGGKNTCSNAPSAVFGVKLYQTTKDNTYLTAAKELYLWTKTNLQDPSDYLYWDNKKVDGRIETPKYSYNSGQMLQAAVLLYNATKDQSYLNDAKLIAESAHNYFFEKYTLSTGETINILKKGNLWFNAIMFRGFVELYHVDRNDKYIKSFKQSLDHAWKYARDPATGLFSTDFSGRTSDNEKELLTQGGIIEMFARMHDL